MASGRNSKAIRALALALSIGKTEMVDEVKYEGVYTKGTASTVREYVVGMDMDGKEITAETRTLCHVEGSYRQVLKQLKREFRSGELQIG